MHTSLRGIANKAALNKTHRFQSLYSLLTFEFLLYCWQFVNKRAAPGVDRIDATEYGLYLHDNVLQLEDSVKSGWYRAKLVLRKYIPKLNGKLRPLGIPAIADKLLQMAVTKLLEAIYEEDFLPCSYGYRPGTGAHKAVKDLSATLRTGRYAAVVEADIKGFFDHIDHNKLLNMLMRRIDDKPLLKLIRRWLKAGILDTTGQVLHPLSGTPQGGIVSPMLANVYLHYVLDMWFEETVKRYCKGNATLYRYADDFVCCFELVTDAERFYEVLPKRLAKFGLEVAADKTQLLQFHRGSKLRFCFLGFEFYWGRSRFGKTVMMRRTDRKKYRSAIANFKAWCKESRGLRMPVLFVQLNQKLRGYWQYYGVRGNYKSMNDYLQDIKRILLKWLNRRSQRRSYNWTGFAALINDFNLSKPHIYHKF
jgi:RNA-directed DNA polymerase